MKKETNILKLCQLAVAECGGVALRNNRGQFYTMDCVKKLISLVLSMKFAEAAQYAKKCMRMVRAGIEAPGSSDLIGWTKDGRFLAIEVKTATGRVSKEQQRFLDIVNKYGGVGFVARSPEDVFKNLN